jgi:hypothetical protein
MLSILAQVFNEDMSDVECIMVAVDFLRLYRQDSLDL